MSHSNTVLEKYDFSDLAEINLESLIHYLKHKSNRLQLTLKVNNFVAYPVLVVNDKCLSLLASQAGTPELFYAEYAMPYNFYSFNKRHWAVKILNEYQKQIDSTWHRERQMSFQQLTNDVNRYKMMVFTQKSYIDFMIKSLPNVNLNSLLPKTMMHKVLVNNLNYFVEGIVFAPNFNQIVADKNFDTFIDKHLLNEIRKQDMLWQNASAKKLVIAVKSNIRDKDATHLVNQMAHCDRQDTENVFKDLIHEIISHLEF